MLASNQDSNGKLVDRGPRPKDNPFDVSLSGGVFVSDPEGKRKERLKRSPSPEEIAFLAKSFTPHLSTSPELEIEILGKFSTKYDLSFKPMWVEHYLTVPIRLLSPVSFFWMAQSPMNVPGGRKYFRQALQSDEFKDNWDSKNGLTMRLEHHTRVLEAAVHILDPHLRDGMCKLLRELSPFVKEAQASYGLRVIDDESNEPLNPHCVRCHEHIHGIMYANGLELENKTPLHFQWNEGLVCYLTDALSDNSWQHSEGKDKWKATRAVTGNPWQDAYEVYPHFWYKMLNHLTSPKERRDVISAKINEVDAA